jgi:hypothetical protein
VDLDKEEASTALRYQYIVPSTYLCFLIAFGFTCDFCAAMGLRGQKVILFWCLMPKGEKLRPKQLYFCFRRNYGQSHCEYCERNGHLANFCFRRKRDERRVSKMSRGNMNHPSHGVRYPSV